MLKDPFIYRLSWLDRGRPPWERGGAQLVADTGPWSIRKLRVLNAAHSLLAYAGGAAGYAHVHEAVADPALVEAVRRVALVAERSRPVRLSFTQGQVVLEAGDGEDAQASEAIPAQLHGDDVSIAFNPQFLLDGLGALNMPFVRLSFTLPTKPAVLTGQTDEDGEPSDHYRYLLMPVRMAG